MYMYMYTAFDGTCRNGVCFLVCEAQLAGLSQWLFAGVVWEGGREGGMGGEGRREGGKGGRDGG